MATYKTTKQITGDCPYLKHTHTISVNYIGLKRMNNPNVQYTKINYLCSYDNCSMRDNCPLYESAPLNF